MAGHDAQIAADVGKDGADRLATYAGGDLLRGGQLGKSGSDAVAVRRGELGGARRARGCGTVGSEWRVEARGVADEAFFQRLGAMQALGDAGENQCQVGAAELARDGGRALLPQGGGEFAAVVDQLADEGEEAADAAFGGWVGWSGGRRVGHECTEAWLTDRVKKYFHGDGPISHDGWRRMD